MKIYLCLLYFFSTSIAFAGETEEGSFIQVAGLFFSVLAFKLFRRKKEK